MQPQLRAIIDEYEQASERLHGLLRTAPPEAWAARPAPGRWSAAECVAHLNLTAEAYLPVLRSAIEEARAAGGDPPRRYRRDPVGWLIWKSVGPAPRFKVSTGAAFVPVGDRPADELVPEFDRLQDEQIRLVERCDGLRLDRTRIASRFDPRVKYNLYACLTILPRHQHRHLWQAEQAIAGR